MPDQLVPPGFEDQPMAVQRAWAALPQAIKDAVSPKEYAWLSDAEKARLIQTETEPDAEL